MPFSWTPVSLSKNCMTNLSICSGWCFSWFFHKQCRRLRFHSPLSPPWLQSHDVTQRGVPQGLHPPVSVIWIPVFSLTKCTLSQIYFTVPLPDFKQNWMTLIGDNILFPGHSTVSFFFKSTTTFTNDPSINYVSAKHIISPFPPSLLKSPDHSNPDHQVWLDLYNE